MYVSDKFDWGIDVNAVFLKREPTETAGKHKRMPNWQGGVLLLISLSYTSIQWRIVIA